MKILQPLKMLMGNWKKSQVGYRENNNGKPHLRWSPEAVGGEVPWTPDQLQERQSITDPNRSPQQERIVNYWKKCTLHPKQKSTTPATQPMKNHHNPELSLFSNGLLFKITPPKFFLFPYKITFFPFDCWICLWSAIAWHILNCDSLPNPE